MIFALESGAGSSQNGTLGLHCLSEMRDSIKTFVAKILRILGPKSLDCFLCVCVCKSLRTVDNTCTYVKNLQ
jgi:hypothetical protein